VEVSVHSRDGIASASIRRSVRRFFLYQISTEMRFESAIWIIYLQSRGLSLAEVGLAEAAFHMAPLLIEIPSGSFADLVGRRWSLATGSVLVAVSAALLWSAHSLPLAMLALFLSGASFSFRSGADQAYLFDTLGLEEDGQRSYPSLVGRMLGAMYLVGAGAAWIGAAVSDIDYGFTFGLAIAVGLGGAWLAAGLLEPKRIRQATDTTAHHESIRQHIVETRGILRGSRVLTLMLAFSAVYWVAATISHLYLQAAFADRGLSNSDIGLVVGATGIVNAAGAAMAGRVAGRGSFTSQLIILVTISGLGLIGTGVSGLAIAITAYLIANLASGLVEPLLYNWYNERIDSSRRATILSVESWLFSLTMIFAFPATGWFAEQAGWSALYSLCGGVTLFLVVVILFGRYLRRAPQAAIET
jgi:MFS family permease